MSDDPDDYGYCNSCGEEALLDTECCDDGEVVEYDVPATATNPDATSAAGNEGMSK